MFQTSYSQETGVRIFHSFNSIGVNLWYISQYAKSHLLNHFTQNTSKLCRVLQYFDWQKWGTVCVSSESISRCSPSNCSRHALSLSDYILTSKILVKGNHLSLRICTFIFLPWAPSNSRLKNAAPVQGYLELIFRKFVTSIDFEVVKSFAYVRRVAAYAWKRQLGPKSKLAVHHTARKDKSAIIAPSNRHQAAYKWISWPYWTPSHCILQFEWLLRFSLGRKKYSCLLTH